MPCTESSSAARPRTLELRQSPLTVECLTPLPQVATQYLQFLLAQRKFADAAALCPELLKVLPASMQGMCFMMWLA